MKTAIQLKCNLQDFHPQSERSELIKTFHIIKIIICTSSVIFGGLYANMKIRVLVSFIFRYVYMPQTAACTRMHYGTKILKLKSSASDWKIILHFIL